MKQIYSKPEMSIVLVEPATMLAMSDDKLEFYNTNEKVDQMSNGRREERVWGNLWRD